LSQPVTELDGKNLPRPMSEIPWGHNLILLFKIKDPLLRLWYAQQTVQHGWSRTILDGADPVEPLRPTGQGRIQLCRDVTAAAVRPRPADAERPLPLRFPHPG